MSVFHIVYRRLTTDATLLALIGDRVWETMSLTGGMPYIVVDVEREPDDSLQPTGILEYTVTLDIVASSAGEREAIVAQVLALIDRQQWTDGTTSILTASLQGDQPATVNSGGAADGLVFTNNMTFHFLVEK